MRKEVVPITKEDMEKTRALIEGVEIDLDEALPEDGEDCSEEDAQDSKSNDESSGNP